MTRSWTEPERVLFGGTAGPETAVTAAVGGQGVWGGGVALSRSPAVSICASWCPGPAAEWRGRQEAASVQSGLTQSHLPLSVKTYLL